MRLAPGALLAGIAPGARDDRRRRRGPVPPPPRPRDHRRRPGRPGRRSSAACSTRGRGRRRRGHPRHEHPRGDGLAPPPRRSPPSRPIVLTGAMRPASALSGDGPLNLVNAVRVAASPARARPRHPRGPRRHHPRRPRRHQVGHAAGLGVPRRRGRARSAGSTATGAWCSPTCRARGWPLEGRFAGVDLRALPRVDIVVTYQGADGVLVDAAVAAGARGIVSAGTGAGYPTPRRGRGAGACVRGRRHRRPGLARGRRPGAASPRRSRAAAGSPQATSTRGRRGSCSASRSAAGITDPRALQALFDEG